MPTSARRPRPLTATFDADSLLLNWRTLARLRDPGFSWLGDSYQSTHRGAPDEASLAEHAEPLKHLLLLASSGFPSHPVLVQVLLDLNEQYKILNVADIFARRTATLAAEGWRTMCKHCYQLKASLKQKQKHK